MKLLKLQKQEKAVKIMVRKNKIRNKRELAKSMKDESISSLN